MKHTYWVAIKWLNVERPLGPQHVGYGHVRRVRAASEAAAVRQAEADAREFANSTPARSAALETAREELDNLRLLLRGMRKPEPTMLGMAMDKADVAIAKAKGEG